MHLWYLPVAILSETMQVTMKTNLSALAMVSNYFKKDFQKVEPNPENQIIKTKKTSKLKIVSNLPSWR